MKFPLPVLFFLSAPAFAGTVFCRADYDEGSHYEVTVNVSDRGVGSTVALRYVTDDGIDLRSDLTTKTQSYVAGKSLSLQAENDSMSTELGTSFDAEKRAYVGRLLLNFSLDHAEPLTLDVSCLPR